MSKFKYHSSLESSITPIKNDNGDREETEEKIISIPNTKKPTKGGWNAAIFIIFVEVAEQFAYIGLASNLIMYLTNVLEVPISMAAKQVNIWVGVSAIFPLFGAYVADSFLGRFNTILFSSSIYFLGLVLLALSEWVIPSNSKKAVFFIALYVLSIGEGGHKPCVQTFAADQFEEDTAEDRKIKSSFFNWWYLGLVIGSTFAVFVVIYVQDNLSWALGFGILAGVLGVAIAWFLIGIKRYRRLIPLGSPFTILAHVAVAAARKWRVDEKLYGWRVCYGDEESGAQLDGQPRVKTLARTNQLSFLDKAMMIDNIDESRNKRNPWRLCTLNQVEEVKLVIRLIPIWLSCLMFTVVQAQLHTYFTKQGSTMIRSIGPHFQLPPASLQGLVGLTILLAVPLYDRIFVPIVRKFTGHPSGITILQRIGIGLFLSILNMVVSALVETKRVKIATDYNLIDSPKSIIPMRVWWLLPQYMICGFSDAFTIVGLQELFYDQMPNAMRSLGAAAYISVVGMGNFMSSAIISALQAISSMRGEKWLGDNLNDSHLDYFYWVLAVLSTLNLFLYVWISYNFVYKKIEGEEANYGDKELNLNAQP